MAETVDLSHAVRFDLSSGSIQLEGGAQAVVLPADALGELVSGVPADARVRVGRAVGQTMGKAAAARAGGASGVLAASLESVASQLGAELAVRGMGTLAIERWGRALVLHVTSAPITSADFYVGLLEGAMDAMTGRTVGAALLSDAGGVRVLVASAGGALRVRGWIEQGVSWSDALVRLQAGSGA